jgi:hypothetical protein
LDHIKTLIGEGILSEEEGQAAIEKEHQSQAPEMVQDYNAKQ